MIGSIVEVRIEVPRGGFVKRGSRSNRVVLVSPLPSPFNYGSVHAIEGGDGDPLDAVVLGPAIRIGSDVEVPVRAIVRFVDRGLVDDKLVCSVGPLDARALARVEHFFRFYAFGKGTLSRLVGVRSPTAFRGVRE